MPFQAGSRCPFPIPQVCHQLAIAVARARVEMADAVDSDGGEQRTPEQSTAASEPEGQVPAVAGSATEADFQCAACKELLLDPVVFTCGHAVCGTCLVPEEEPLGSCPQCDMPLVGRPRLCKLVSPFPLQMWIIGYPDRYTCCYIIVLFSNYHSSSNLPFREYRFIVM